MRYSIEIDLLSRRLCLILFTINMHMCQPIGYKVHTKIIGDGIKFWPSAIRRPQRATALAPTPLQLCPHRVRAAEPTPCPSKFRRSGFRARTLDGYRGESVPRSFLTRKFDADLRMRRRNKMRPPSSSRMKSSAYRATAMVLADHSSA